jgi:hypothetical protein
VNWAQLLLERLAEYGNDQLQAPMASYQLGELLEQQGRLEEAENEYRRVIEIHDETRQRYGLPELSIGGTTSQSRLSAGLPGCPGSPNQGASRHASEIGLVSIDR